MMWMFLLLGSLVAAEDCDVARLKCAYRTGCSQALHSYMLGCSDVLSGKSSRCPWACKRALVSLTSTEVGHSLATCECGDDEFCQRSKEHVEVCRPEVSHATADDTVVSCSVAEWICAADPLCSTALSYYHQLCKSMFHGRKCSPRCNNSLGILDRQEKAAKLRNCYCDGSENYPCTKIRENTQRLCFGRVDWVEPLIEDDGLPSAAAVSQNKLETVLLLIILYICSTNLEIRTDFLLSLTPYFAFPQRSSKISSQTQRSPISTGTEKIQRKAFRYYVWPWWWNSELPPNQ